MVMMSDEELGQRSVNDVAVIGMSGRFPGARDLDQFWANISGGVESIARLTDEELVAAGESPELISRPNYVGAKGVLEDPDVFDAEFFGFNPREAEVTDPQHRLFLEQAWSALENAGYIEGVDGPVGVYGSASGGSYLIANLLRNPEVVAAAGGYQLMIGNDKDFVPTRVSYKLNLKGPSLAIQTACSSSLVAIQVACQSLLTFQTDMAIAGGVSLSFPQNVGYLYEEGMILSPDGRCRPFDAEARGTVSGCGVGVVVLKRLSDALHDGDTIHAVVKGAAINNDGSGKVGYTAPSVDGQAEVIAMAQGLADIEPDTISYVETHGTGTQLGDPIEIAALTQVFRASTEKKQFCAIGSLKSNIGHLDAAAGVAGFIKTVLALEHKILPPSLHFKKPNPQIDFESSPFYVQTTASEWETDGGPRRAGVSSFGIGGTNAHVVLEEAPEPEPSSSSRPYKALVWSARTSSALGNATQNLFNFIRDHEEVDLADVAYTLQVGRKVLPQRSVLVCRDRDDALEALEARDSRRVLVASQESTNRPVVFMFSGQGSQYVNMAAELYRNEAAFRNVVDDCARLLEPHLGCDLREVIYPPALTGHSGNDEGRRAFADRLNQTQLAQPSLFVVEYALARLWMEWGVHPEAMIGHSIGEYVAACLARVMSLEDALKVVALRGRLMQEMPTGSMLAVPMSVDELTPRLGQGVSLAAINGPAFCTVSGPTERIERLERRLSSEGIPAHRIHTSHAFHSAMMDPILEPFAEQLRGIRLGEPEIPYVSNVTGTWITPSETRDATYWAKHLRNTVRFADGLKLLWEDQSRVLLEVGPGNMLCTFAKQAASGRSGIVHGSLPHPKDNEPSDRFILTSLCQLWQSGVRVDWVALHREEHLHRVPLPTYPFDRSRFWVEPQSIDALVAGGDKTHGSSRISKKSNISEWFYLHSWKRCVVHPNEALIEKGKWLVFLDEQGLATKLVHRLQRKGQQVICVMRGPTFERLEDETYSLRMDNGVDYLTLIRELSSENKLPDRVLHLWSMTSNPNSKPMTESFETAQDQGFYSLLFLTQAFLKNQITRPVQIDVITNNLHEVTGEEITCPERATVLGLCKVIPQEIPNIICRNVDVERIAVEPDSKQENRLIEQLLAECSVRPTVPAVAYRGPYRWEEILDSYAVSASEDGSNLLRHNGVYLITGGMGKIGLVLARYLAEALQARIILLGRSPFPLRHEWEDWLESHGADDDITQRIEKIQHLEEFGAEVMVLQADVADKRRMEAVISEIYERFETLHGVIHAAGTVVAQPIEDINRVTCESQFRPKAHGLMVLEEVLRGKALDFCFLTSSMSSVLGGLGFAAYAAANIFMDSFALKANRGSSFPWIAVNWDGWRLEESASRRLGVGSALDELLISVEEGAEVFQRLLSSYIVSPIVVSTGDLDARIDQWITPREALSELEEVYKVEIAATHERPELGSSYVAPRNENDQILVRIWGELLGIDTIGIDDNFFELGGHSLLATRVLSRIQEMFEIRLSLQTIFECPTIAELSDRIGTLTWAKHGSRDTTDDLRGDFEELEF